jgi:hypothetical protein
LIIPQRCEAAWSAVTSGAVEGSLVASFKALNERHHRLFVQSSFGLENIIDQRKLNFDVVLADLPELPTRESTLSELRSWTHTLKGIEGFASERLNEGGKIVLLVGDRAFAWLATAVEFKITQVVAWQGKYGPTNDSGTTIDDWHRFIVVLEHQNTGSGEFKLLPHTTVKAQDGSKEFSAQYPGIEKPKRYKPQKLWSWIYSNILGSGQSVIDLTYSGSGLSHLEDKNFAVTDVLWAEDKDLPVIAAICSEEIDSNSATVNSTPDIGKCSCRTRYFTEGRTRYFTEESDEKQAASYLKLLDPTLGQTSLISGKEDALKSAVRLHLRSSADVVITDGLDADIAGEIIKTGGVLFTKFSSCDDLQRGYLTLSQKFSPLGHLIMGEESGYVSIWAVSWKNLEENEPLLGKSSSFKHENKDQDPRGAWRKMSHKGAKSGNDATSFQLRVPPYKFKHIDGDLPPGLWRLNQHGIIWGTPTSLGKWKIEVTIEDKNSVHSTETIMIVVRDVETEESKDANSIFEFITWLSTLPSDKGALRLKSTNYTVVLNTECSILLEGEGGAPFDEVIEPPGEALIEGGRTRYWEYKLETLSSRLREDLVVWNPPAKPGKKRYESESRSRKISLKSVFVKAVNEFSHEFNMIYGSLTPGLRVLSIDTTLHQCNLYFEHLLPARYEAEFCKKCEKDRNGTSCTLDHSVQKIGLLLHEGSFSKEVKDLADLTGVRLWRASSLQSGDSYLVLDGGITTKMLLDEFSKYGVNVSGALATQVLDADGSKVRRLDLS